MQGVPEERAEVRVGELRPGEVEGWTGGSKCDGRAAGATRTRGIYLGTMATVADAESAEVILAWEEADTILHRVMHHHQEVHQPPRSPCRFILGGVMESKMNGFVASKVCKHCEDIESS